MHIPTLFFATTNNAKLSQLRWIADHLGYEAEVVSAVVHFGDAARYDEVGETEAEIAQCGAWLVAQQIGAAVLAEDTGLHVEALGGRPGVHAGRYLKEHGRAGLLRELQAYAKRENRSAVVVSAVAYAMPDGECWFVEHRVPGRIVTQERWRPGLPDWIAPTDNNPSGGGYNAVFVPDGETRTLAEIPPQEALVWGYRESNFIATLQFFKQIAAAA